MIQDLSKDKLHEAIHEKIDRIDWPDFGFFRAEVLQTQA
jgi:hypothetical protein